MTDAEIEPAALGLTLSGQPLPVFEAAPSSAHGPSPLRRPGSVRRTMTIDVTWPNGKSGPGVYDGDCRDVLTPADGGAPLVLAEDTICATADQRTITAVSSTTSSAALDGLIGVRAGGHLRAALERVVPREKAAGAPIYLLLDDLAGATLVSGWAFSRWTDDWVPSLTPELQAQRVNQMAGVCIGFRPGSSALATNHSSVASQNVTRVEPLLNPDDPQGWHKMIERTGVNFRRARRIDIWREDNLLRIDSTFQDTASSPDGGNRIAIHEYRLQASADASTGLLLSVMAAPGTLPFKECPAATSNIDMMVGTPLSTLREEVLQVLRRTAGCTHLNDMMRALAEVPVLAAHLPSVA